MWKNFRKAIYGIILTGVLSLIFVFGGCVNTKDGDGEDSSYILRITKAEGI